MEINKIGEAEQAIGSKELRSKKNDRKKCLYYPEAACNTQKLPYKICEKCPRAIGQMEINHVHNLFSRIRAYAISLLDKMNIQLSK